MIKLWHRFIDWMLQGRVAELKRIESMLNDEIAKVQPVYTVIRPFTGINAEYYGWICRMLMSDEFRFLCFDLRENLIRTMIGLKDEKELIRINGQIDMINMIGTYLTRYKHEYESQIQRNKESSAR